jgi:flagellar hook-associated protein 2
MSATPPITLSNFTGIDFNQLLQAVISEADVPVTDLQNQVSADNTQISTLGQIGGNLTTLQNALNQLQNDTTITPLTASTSSDAPVSAAVTGDALSGSYDVSVNTLAAAQVSASQGYSSDTSTVGTGTIAITVGGSTSNIDITSSNDALDGVAAAINQANLGVTAQVVNTGLAGDPYRLEITANATGSSGAFSVSANLTGGTTPNFATSSIGSVQLDSVTGSSQIAIGGTYSGALSQQYQFTVTSGGSAGSSAISIQYTSGSGESGTITVPSDYTPGSPISVVDGLNLSLGSGTLNTGDTFSVAAFNPTLVQAENASVEADNQVVSSSSNNVTNAIPGVTLSLSGTGGPSVVTVSPNEAGISNDVSNFVNAYNQVISQISSDTQAVPNSTAPALANNGALESAASAMQFALTGVNLSALGISIDSQNGQLEFNATTLANQFQSNSTLVTSTISSLNQALSTQVNDALDPTTGVIATETNELNQQITNLNQQISSMQNQITQEQSSLQAEYATLQSNVLEYQNLSSLISNEYSGSSSSSSSTSTSTSAPGSNLTIDS